MDNPKPGFRLLIRNGEKVLQQAWSITEIFDNGTISYPTCEWRDVPIVHEPPTTLDRFNQINADKAAS